MAMTPEAKSKLSKIIRGTQNGDGGLRALLLRDLHNATESAYRMGIRLQNADLKAAPKEKRRRLESWIAEQVRAESGKYKRDHNDFRRIAEKQAAYTLLNRLVFLRLLEAAGLRKPLVVTGGWDSRGYKDFREIAPALCDVRHDESEGYAFLLQLIFEDLATDLPGLYGSAGIADLIPVPASTLRAVVEAFDDLALASCWTDDMTLGWVYQYWNDPDREALDAKINEGGKIEPHEIASKTQMFTERYMVDWLLQNSLGPMWLAMCKKHGSTPEVEANGTLDALEQRRVEWRAKRDERQAALDVEKAKQEKDKSYKFDEKKLPGVSLTELMPLYNEAERRWAYYVPQPIPDDAVQHAPDTVRDLKILDPAVGSGHFLVVAFDLLFALYEEEARHRGCEPNAPASAASGDDTELPAASAVGSQDWTPQAITQCILEYNLHGIDLDPRAVQIAAAALWLKAQQKCREAEPRQLNLVASNLGIARLPDNDPALVELRRTVEAETGIPAELTNQIVEALRGADHLGSLLKVDAAIGTAIAEHEKTLNWDQNVQQLNLFPDGRIQQQKLRFPRERMEFNLLSALESFLSRHTSAQELGLRLRGEQLAAGVRFVRMVRERSYDLIVANPPYQGTAKMAATDYVEQQYKLGKADLFAAFLLRGLELVREGGVSSMLTMRNWMFIKQYSDLRQHLLGEYDLRAIGDFDRGAFEDVLDEVVSVTVSSFARAMHDVESIALCPTPREDRSRDNERTARKRAATLCHVGRHTFDSAAMTRIPSVPVVYWWDDDLFSLFGEDKPTVERELKVRQGLATGDDTRFLIRPWESSEVGFSAFALRPRVHTDLRMDQITWVPYIKGAAGKRWLEPLDHVIRWSENGLHKKVFFDFYGSKGGNGAPSEADYFNGGLVFSTIGSQFGGRMHRYASVFASTGCTVFGANLIDVCGLFNSTLAQTILESFNPTIHFTNNDVERLPILRMPNAGETFSQVVSAFGVHESSREPSVEFQYPGPSPWRHAQEWAQRAVDRSEGEPLPEYVEQLDPEPPTDHLSFAVGVALGRFGANGEGILDPETGLPVEPTALAAGHDKVTPQPRPDASAFGSQVNSRPQGILFLDGTLAETDDRDSLGHPAAQIIHAKWSEFGPAINAGKRPVSVRDWLRERFFVDVHKSMYETRPIHWPLSSAKKTFVAWINIHRLNEATLRVLLADHLQPALTRLDGELDDLREARDGGDAKAARDAAGRFADVKKWRDELVEFIANVEQCAEKGPAPPDPKKPEREADARYDPDLDDGVMINSAALWPLLEPQWKDPKKWWNELVKAKGKKDYDWSHLAMRYWPTRVDKKCQADPSLGVAHGCFWKYHAARAWAWELRLQDEIAPDFRIEEASYRGDGGDDEHRAVFLLEHPDEAFDAVAKELKRRIRKHEEPVAEMRLLEPGIWSAVPHRCWELELATSKKQAAAFRLDAPDAEVCRKAFAQANPEQAAVRQELLAGLATRQL
ncbi:MAG: BREX-6 system adenine-specific DNA-methyltransferase PglX [Candidatus Paceibacterota bacterium]